MPPPPRPRRHFTPIPSTNPVGHTFKLTQTNTLGDMASLASGLVSWPSLLTAQLPVPLAHAYLRPHTLVSGPHLGAFGKRRALSTPQADGV